MDIGRTLKVNRLEKGYTISEVAEAIKVSPGLISQIENNTTTPSIQTLRDILSYYRLPLSAFFRQAEEKDLVAVRGDSMETIRGEKGVIVSLLASKLANNVLESYHIKLTSSEQLNLSGDDSLSNGERFVYVLKGTIRVTTAKGMTVLQAGDSLNFKSHLSCAIKRDGRINSEFILTGTPEIL